MYDVTKKEYTDDFSILHAKKSNPTPFSVAVFQSCRR